MVHVKLFEEIGFSYSGKAGDEKSEEGEKIKNDMMSFSLSSVEKTYKKVAKSAFNAGRNSAYNFDEWWSSVWDVKKEEKSAIVRGKVGYDLPVKVENNLKKSEETTNYPRRIGPTRPKKPLIPVKPSKPSKPGIRKGIWFEEDE